VSRIVALASGSGTLLQAVLDAQAEVGAEVVAIGSDQAGVPALQRAGAIPTFVVPVGDFDTRAAWDAALADRVAGYKPDWVLSLGFMRLLGPAFLGRFAGRIVNSHPALLPAFPGAHGVRDALAYGVKVTGCTVHLVDAGVDSGPIIAQEAVAVRPDDDEASLHERIKVVERRLVVDVVAGLIASGYTIRDRKVTIP
jgi:formyltetrahydrofolate-dependent phosphoribosylglycinamide formyltransferase